MTADRFNVPLYTIAEASRHLGIGAETLRRWTFRDQLVTVADDRKRLPNLPFIAMVEAQFYAYLRDEGLTLRAIREGMRAVRSKLGHRMMQKERLAHDGADILVNLADTGESPDWMRARDSQDGIKGVVERGLRPITFGEDGLPTQVRLTAYQGAEVIVDPRFAFGQPIEANSGTRVEDIVSLLRAGDPVSVVAEEFEVEPDVVESIYRVNTGKAA